MTTVPRRRRGRTSSPAREPTAAGLYRRWHTPRQRHRHSTGRAGAWHAEKNSATPKTSGRDRRDASRPRATPAAGRAKGSSACIRRIARHSVGPASDC